MKKMGMVLRIAFVVAFVVVPCVNFAFAADKAKPAEPDKPKEAPKKPLWVQKITKPKIWDKAAPGSESSITTEKEVTTFKVKYPADAKKTTVIGFYGNGNQKPVVKPIMAKWPIRVKGKGVLKVYIWMRSKTWEKLQVKYKPTRTPDVAITSDEWKVMELKETKDKKGKKIEKMGEFYAYGITVKMKPGAEFTVECKSIEIYEK